MHSLDDLRAAAASMGEELTTKIRAGEADGGGWRGEVLAVVRQSVEDKLRIPRIPVILEATSLFATPQNRKRRSD